MGNDNPSHDYSTDPAEPAVPNDAVDTSPDVATVSVGDETVQITPDTTVETLRELPSVDADSGDVLSVVHDDGRLKPLRDESTRVLKHVDDGGRLAFHPPLDKTDVGTPTGGGRRIWP